jgi:hypothetical protein
MTGICRSGCLIVGIIRLLGIRIEYLIVRMIGICGSGHSVDHCIGRIQIEYLIVRMIGLGGSEYSMVRIIR